MKKQQQLSDQVKVVLYARISRDRANETSIENQTREMKALCVAMGYQVVGTFHDRGRSAYKLDIDRQGFEEAMSMIENHQATKLIVWKLDRMTRNARGFMKINERLEAMGASFQSVQEPWFDTSTPIGLALVQLMVALAEMEAEGIKGRALSWHEGRRGKLMPPTGNRPFGFKRPEPSSLAIDAKEAPIVTEMFDRVMSGEGLRAIAKDFTARNIKTAQGNGNGWSHSTIRSILLNPTTAGMVEVNGSFVDSPLWEGILTEDEFMAVRELLTNPDRCSHIEGGSDARKLKHLLPGLMTCGKCGKRMVTKSHSRGRQYGCESCELSIMANVADELIEELVLSWPEDKWQSLVTQGKGNDPAVIEDIQRRIDSLFIERATHPNRVSESVYESTMAILEAQLEAAQTAPKVDIPAVESLTASWPTMTNYDRRRVIGALFDRITVLPYAKGQTGRARFEVAIKSIDVPNTKTTKKGK